MTKYNVSKPLISIIIPIYNVAPYLPSCLESCKAQTIENLQFILIDDGSTDKSGKIADQFSMEDSRFQVYHTENHGLSAALNYGLTKADAEWIMFIDSDDWVDPQFCELPLQAAMEFEADLVAFNIYYVKNNEHIERKLISNREIVDVTTGIVKGDIYRYNKLYHINLFDGIHYPEERNSEDTSITAKQIYMAKRIVCIPDFLYYYRKRKDSITHLRTFYTDLFIAELERYEFLIEKGYPVDKEEKFLFNCTIDYLSHVRPDKSDELYLKASSVISNFNISSDKLGRKDRIKLTAWKISPALFHLMYFLKGNKNNKNIYTNGFY